MNLEIKQGQLIAVETEAGTQTGNFQGYTSINQLLHVVLCTTTLAEDTIILIPVHRVIFVKLTLIGEARL